MYYKKNTILNKNKQFQHSIMILTMNLFALGVIILATVIEVDAFSGVVVSQRTRPPTRTRTRQQPSQLQEASLLSPCALSYLIRDGDDEFVDNNNNGDDFFDQNMIDDLQNQHLQLMQMQQQVHQQVQQQQSYSITPLLPKIIVPSASPVVTITNTAATTMNNNNNNVVNGIYSYYDNLYSHDDNDLNKLNISSLHSKVSFIRRLLLQPKIMKQYINRLVKLLIKFILK